MKEILYVFLGGGCGSVIRFCISMVWRHMSLHPRYADIIFPWPTFIANIIGCVLIGIFYEYAGKLGLTPEMRLLLTTGLCGGFTTFSTFSYENITLIRNGFYTTSAIYITASIICGLIATTVPFILSSHS